MDGWTKYQLAHPALVTGNFEVADEIYQQLLSSSISEKHISGSQHSGKWPQLSLHYQTMEHWAYHRQLSYCALHCRIFSLWTVSAVVEMRVIHFRSDSFYCGSTSLIISLCFGSLFERCASPAVSLNSTAGHCCCICKMSPETLLFSRLGSGNSVDDTGWASSTHNRARPFVFLELWHCFFLLQHAPSFLMCCHKSPTRHRSPLFWEKGVIQWYCLYDALMIFLFSRWTTHWIQLFRWQQC